jgi:hypothetical protein
MQNKIIAHNEFIERLVLSKQQAVAVLKAAHRRTLETDPERLIGERDNLPSYHGAYFHDLKVGKFYSAPYDHRYNGANKALTLKEMCEKNNIFEVVTLELTTKIIEMIFRIAGKNFNYQQAESLRILELGAGSGKLAYHLERALKGSALPLEFWATNEYPRRRGLWRNMYLGENIIPMRQDKAVEHYKPHIILCSWMPPKQDWSFFWRSFATTQAYILTGSKKTYIEIGNADTWGAPKQGTTEPQAHKPLYEQAGFKKSKVNYVPLISRYGLEVSKLYLFERTEQGQPGRQN